MFCIKIFPFKINIIHEEILDIKTKGKIREVFKNTKIQLSEKLKERAKLFDWKNSATLYFSLYNQILNS